MRYLIGLALALLPACSAGPCNTHDDMRAKAADLRIPIVSDEDMMSVETDMQTDPPDLSPMSCVFDYNCGDPVNIRCYKGRCYPWVSDRHCGNGADGGGTDCTGLGDPAVVCCLDPGLQPPNARCTSVKRDFFHCGMCGRKCKEGVPCRDGIC